MKELVKQKLLQVYPEEKGQYAATMTDFENSAHNIMRFYAHEHINGNLKEHEYSTMYHGKDLYSVYDASKGMAVLVFGDSMKDATDKVVKYLDAQE